VAVVNKIVVQPPQQGSENISVELDNIYRTNACHVLTPPHTGGES
jgi:hypothetical protein